MKILVTCKRVPNPEQKLKIGAGKIDLSGASWQINTFDEYAVETALRLTEKGKGGERSGEVVVVSIGPKDVAQQLRGVLAMGADRGILVGSDDAALDADAVARILRAVVEREKPDLVVLGKQTVDGDSNQVGQILAGLLGWPQATFLASCRARRRRQERDGHARGRRRRRGEARAPAGGGHRRPAHHRQEGGAQRSARRRRRRVGRDPALRLAQGDHGGEEKGDQRDRARRSSPISACRRRP